MRNTLWVVEGKHCSMVHYIIHIHTVLPLVQNDLVSDNCLYFNLMFIMVVGIYIYSNIYQRKKYILCEFLSHSHLINEYGYYTLLQKKCTLISSRFSHDPRSGTVMPILSKLMVCLEDILISLLPFSKGDTRGIHVYATNIFGILVFATDICGILSMPQSNEYASVI